MSATGRAARQQLERRLVTARHGAELLDRKQHILAEELDRLELQADRAAELWRRRAAQAATWLARAAALDGADRVEAATSPRPLEVRVRTEALMGVAFQSSTRCALPPSAVRGGSSALATAVIAHQDAVVAGVALAAAERAVQVVSAELAATRMRQRAVEHRWVPRLEFRLAQVTAALAELELEESLRLRWAARATSAGTGAGSAGTGTRGGLP